MKRFATLLVLGLVYFGCAKESGINWVQGEIQIRAYSRLADADVPWEYVIFFSRGFSAQYHQLEVFVDGEIVSRSLIEPNRVRMLKGRVTLTREFYLSHYREAHDTYEPLSWDEPRYSRDAAQGDDWDGRVKIKVRVKNMEGKVLAQTRYTLILSCRSCLV